jgi:integrase
MDDTATRDGPETARERHPRGLRRRGRIWSVRYYRDGRRYEESSHSDQGTKAKKLLRLREGQGDQGVPITPQVGRLRFEDAAQDLITDYKTNKRKSATHIKRHIDRALTPYFRGRRMVSITSADVRTYIDARQKAGAANASINRELAALKRMFTLAVQAGRLVSKPHIPMLAENNTRRGFFEAEQFAALRDHLPADLRPLATVAYFTGWRLRSELLRLEWRNVDTTAKTIRLDPGTTRNRDGRVFVFAGIAALEGTFAELSRRRDILRRQGMISPRVFLRVYVNAWKGTERIAPVANFRRSWLTACKAAGCPGRIPHDFRRTAVRNLERAGVPRSTAMAMVGHKTESIYRRYAIVSESDLKAAAIKIQNATGTISGTIGDQQQESVSLPNRVTA